MGRSKPTSTAAGALASRPNVADDAHWLNRVTDDEAKEREPDPHEQAIWEQSEEGRQAIVRARTSGLPKASAAHPLTSPNGRVDAAG